MKPVWSHWTIALCDAWRRRIVATDAIALPGPNDPSRLQFEREYDALIAEMARQLPAAR